MTTKTASEKVLDSLRQLGLSALPPKWTFRTGIQAHPEWLGTPVGQQAVFTVTNLLCRVHPLVTELRIALPLGLNNVSDVPLLGSGEYTQILVEYLSSIGTDMTIVCDNDAQSADLILSLGPQPFAQAVPTIYFESRGWNAHISYAPESLLGSWQGKNPIGALLAGGYAAAEVIKHALLKTKLALPRPVRLIEGDLWFSGWDYSVGSSDQGPLLPAVVQIGKVTIAGVGSGGMATVLALSSGIRLRGRLALVDPDHINKGNLDRYPTAIFSDASAKRLKVELGYELLKGTGVKLLSLPKPWNEVNDKLRDLGMLDYVVSLVHTAIARREIQGDLPREIIDAASNRYGQFVLTRVDFGRTCCLGCIYPPDDKQSEELDSLAFVLGLKREEVERLHRDSIPFSTEQLERIRRNHKLPDSTSIPQEDQTLADWRALHCARFTLKGDEDVPLSPVTFIPGILIAGEILKRGMETEPLNNRYVGDVLGLPSRVHPYVYRPIENCCFCGDPTFLKVYESTWSRA